MFVVRDVSMAAAERMASKLREADLNEIEANHGTGADPAEAILNAIELSAQVYGAYLPNKKTPFAIFGVAELDLKNRNVGGVWLMATPDVASVRFEFLRKCHSWRDILAVGKDTLECLVDERNDLHKAWLTWMGFARGGEFPSALHDVRFNHYYYKVPK